MLACESRFAGTKGREHQAKIGAIRDAVAIEVAQRRELPRTDQQAQVRAIDLAIAGQVGSTGRCRHRAHDRCAVAVRDHREPSTATSSLALATPTATSAMVMARRIPRWVFFLMEKAPSQVVGHPERMDTRSEEVAGRPRPVHRQYDPAAGSSQEASGGVERVRSASPFGPTRSAAAQVTMAANMI